MALPGYSNEPEMQDVSQQRRFAELLRQQSMDPLQGQMIGNRYVAPSWTQGLAKVVQAYGAQKAESDASKQQRALAEALKQKQQDWIGAMPKEQQVMPGDQIGPPQVKQPTPQDYMSWALQGGQIDPSLMTAGMGMVNNMENRSQREDLAKQASADRLAQQQAAAEERRAALEARLADQRISREEAANLRRELAGMQRSTQLQVAGMNNANRQQILEEKKAAADLEKDKANKQATISAQQVLDQAGTLFAHPGRQAATGASSFLGAIPGTRAKGFQANLDTFKAQTFVPMVSALKGMGALSDAEGRKLSDSVGALDPSMPEDEFETSLKGVTRTLYEKAKAAGLNVALPDFATELPEDQAKPAVPSRRASDKAPVLRFDAQGNLIQQ